jgi:hypothetical protein
VSGSNLRLSMCLCASIIQVFLVCQQFLQRQNNGRQLRKDDRGDWPLVWGTSSIGERYGEGDVTQRSTLADKGTPESVEAPFE